MRNLEDLFRTLAKLVDLALDAHFFNGILDAFDIDHTFISEGMEQVVSLDSLLSSLLVAEDQVDPFVQIFRDVLRFKSLFVDLQVDFRISFGPLWHLNVSNFLLVLPCAQVKIHVIFQERGVVKVELGNELLEGGWIFHDIVPVISNALEQPIRLIEPAALQFEHIFWFFSDQIANHIAWSGIVAAVHEFWWLHVLVSFK
jgi:hypothetical protein